MPESVHLALRDDAVRVAAIALAEDGLRDLTSLVSVAPRQAGNALVEVRAPLVVAGLAYADAVIAACDLSPVQWRGADGTTFADEAVLGTLDGDLRAILRVERPLLNLLQRACGIATLTAQFVAATAGTSCRILHTRKTTPGLRLLEIEAVVAGGGTRHRSDLTNDVMIKDNHWRALQQGGVSLRHALSEARALGAASLQVEVEDLSQLEAACAAGATRILIDNQPSATVAEWTDRVRQHFPGIEVEATGGIDLRNAAAYARTGVDFLSIGALTHSVPAADLGLEITGS